MVEGALRGKGVYVVGVVQTYVLSIKLLRMSTLMKSVAASKDIVASQSAPSRLRASRASAEIMAEWRACLT